MSVSKEFTLVDEVDGFVVLGRVESLTRGGGSGFSEDSGFKTEGGSIGPEMYDDLPEL